MVSPQAQGRDLSPCESLAQGHASQHKGCTQNLWVRQLLL